MKSIGYSTKNLSQITNRSIFFDANILLYIFFALRDEHNNKEQYSNIWKQIRKQNNICLIDFLVLSEIINKSFKFEYDALYSEQYKRKEFRNSNIGKQIRQDIYTTISHDIFPYFQVVGKVFHMEDIQNMLTIDTLDFVDKAIVQICQEHHAILLTHDRDFLYSDIEIISRNPVYRTQR